MNTFYKNWKDQKDKKQSEVEDEDDAVEPKIQAANKTQEEVQEEEVLDEQKRAKVYRNLRQLKSSFNPEAAKIIERNEQGREILLNLANFAFFGEGTVEREPSTFEEAWNHDDPRSQEKWREAINKEFEEMEKKQVW
jgi:PAS domain-containing protein